jgi:phosphate-selective porin OprO/OprP
MKHFRYVGIGLLFILLYASPVIAQEFLLGEETKGVKISAAENTNLTIRFRLQPRVDFGDLTKHQDGSRYKSESDQYMRRARLELSGHMIENLRYALHLSADKWGKSGHDDEIKLFYAYLDYTFCDEVIVRVGKAKLPYSRVSLSSSSKQLLIERPVSTESVKKLFDDYYQPNVLVSGRFLEGILAYYLAYGDGWEEGDTLGTGTTVHNADPLFVGRVELSLPGWIEKKKSDAHLGKGRHVTLGVNYATQRSIEYNENIFGEDRNLFGFDISGHWKSMTAQFEYNRYLIRTRFWW